MSWFPYVNGVGDIKYENGKVGIEWFGEASGYNTHETMEICDLGVLDKMIYELKQAKKEMERDEQNEL